MKTSKAPALFVFHNEHNLAPLGAARYRAGVKDGVEVEFIRLVSSARREAGPEFKPLLAISLRARQGHYKCQMLHSPPSISCPLSLSLCQPACFLWHWCWIDALSASSDFVTCDMQSTNVCHTHPHTRAHLLNCTHMHRQPHPGDAH